MAKQRQKDVSDGRVFTVRTHRETYKAIDEFAWERRLTFAAAVSLLIEKGLAHKNEGDKNSEKPGEKTVAV